MVFGQLHQRQDGYLRLIRHEDEEDRSFEKNEKGGYIYIYIIYMYIYIYICCNIYPVHIYIYIAYTYIHTCGKKVLINQCAGTVQSIYCIWNTLCLDVRLVPMEIPRTPYACLQVVTLFKS